MVNLSEKLGAEAKKAVKHAQEGLCKAIGGEWKTVQHRTATYENFCAVDSLI